MGMFPKFPRKVWVSLFPVCLVMAAVTALMVPVSLWLYVHSPVPLPWYFCMLWVLAVWSLMFGAYVVWLTTQGIEYSRSIENV